MRSRVGPRRRVQQDQRRGRHACQPRVPSVPAFLCLVSVSAHIPDNCLTIRCHIFESSGNDLYKITLHRGGDQLWKLPQTHEMTHLPQGMKPHNVRPNRGQSEPPESRKGGGRAPINDGGGFDLGMSGLFTTGFVEKGACMWIVIQSSICVCMLRVCCDRLFLHARKHPCVFAFSPSL